MLSCMWYLKLPPRKFVGLCVAGWMCDKYVSFLLCMKSSGKFAEEIVYTKL